MRQSKNDLWVRQEIQKILKFINDFPMKNERVVVPVSGGLDSDLVARLCCQSLGPERVKLFIVLQSDMESQFLENARSLAQDLKVSLAEIHLENMNQTLMESLEQGEREQIFCTAMPLDPAKAKCSIRSAVISSYQDKGFLIAGTTNRSEKELGFFLTFGDNLAHFKPIAHLYKSQLYPLAKAMGTSEIILKQQPSAGFWYGQTDMEDLAYWIVNNGPIVRPRDFTPQEEQTARQLQAILTYEKIDMILKLHSEKATVADIIHKTSLPDNLVNGIIHIAEKAVYLKNRKILAEILA